MKPRLIAVVGPTASGKSELAIAICQHAGGEVVNADSVQIYRHFDIGSAKLSEAERAGIRHHLVGELDPLDAADASRFVALADACIADIAHRGKLPVVCGGTFLWVRALLRGLVEAPAASEAIRARHRADAERLGREYLHARLAEVDPVSHAKLSPNDFVRVSRALEVHELTGTPLSELQAAHGFRELRYPVQLVAVRHERSVLHERIEHRVLRMFERGFVAEVRGLLRAGYAQARALRSVGYRQVTQALQSGTPVREEALVAEICQATRVFVRRQLTWLRDEPVQWLAPGELPELAR